MPNYPTINRQIMKKDDVHKCTHHPFKKKMCQCGGTECGGTEFCPPLFWHPEKFQTWSKLYPNSLLMMNYYICKYFTQPQVCVILPHCTNCGGTEFWPLLLPSRHKIKKFQPIKPSQILSEVLNSLILYLELLVTLIFDSLLGSTAICFFFVCIQEFEKALSKCGGTENFIPGKYILRVCFESPFLRMISSMKYK